MRKSRVFATVLGGQDMVIEDVMIETGTSRGKRPVTSEVLVFEVRPKAVATGRCSRCQKRCPAMAHVPWARPGARHTWAFEDTCAWLTAHAAISVVAVFLRVAWRTIAAIVGRVVADGRDTNDLLVGLRRIGIDEIAYRKGHRYLTRVVDHTTGRLVPATRTPWPGSSTSSAPTVPLR